MEFFTDQPPTKSFWISATVFPRKLRKIGPRYKKWTLTIVQDDLFGARLASKYLDKELAGRIQQIQLLGRDIRGDEYEQVWNQLEAEIHLHRHKTVIRACRQNLVSFAFFENISFFRTKSNGEYIPVM